MKNKGGSRRKSFEDDEQNEGFDGPNNPDQDEWAIRSSIGLDRTLDYEDEENEYDKVVAGRENAGESKARISSQFKCALVEIGLDRKYKEWALMLITMKVHA